MEEVQTTKTELGNGFSDMREFAIDFADKDIYINGNSFSKGYFTVAVLNYGKDLVTELIVAAQPILCACEDLKLMRLHEERFDQAVRSMQKIYQILSVREPFCYLNLESEKELLDTMCDQKVKDAFCAYVAVVQKIAESSIPESVSLSDAEQEAFAFGKKLHRTTYEIMNDYFYFCHDIANYTLAIINLERMKLRDLECRNEAGFAQACHDFFSDEAVQEALSALRPYQGVSPFQMTPYMRVEMVIIPNPKHPNQMMFARRMHFRRLMDFLTVDFFEGLHVGHSLRQCQNCGRYFHMTDGRHQIYCDGIAPNDPKGRSCRTIGARDVRMEREKARDHPALKAYRRRMNTIDKHLSRGKIDLEFAEQAKALAREHLAKALKNNSYFTQWYEKEISQDVLYTQTAKLLGRIPEQ